MDAGGSPATTIRGRLKERMDLLQNLANGFSVALTPTNLFFAFVGSFLEQGPGGDPADVHLGPARLDPAGEEQAIDDAEHRRFGADAEVMFAAHSWPRWGKDRIQEVMRAQRDAYRAPAYARIVAPVRPAARRPRSRNALLPSRSAPRSRG